MLRCVQDSNCISEIKWLENEEGILLDKNKFVLNNANACIFIESEFISNISSKYLSFFN